MQDLVQPTARYRLRSVRSYLIAVVALAALPGACDRTPPPPATTRPAAKRVVSLAPHITEIVFALGRGSRLVGVTSFCVYPPEARKLPKCGGVIDLDLEKILMLQPDLVLIHGQSENAVRFCRENRIPMLQTSPNDVATLYDAIVEIGRALGCQDRAQELVASMKADIQRVRQATQASPPVKVFLSMSPETGPVRSLYTTNGQGFVSKMLDAAGGENIFARTDVRYPKIDAGELVRRQPDAIIELQPGKTLSPDERAMRTREWQAIGNVPALTGGRVYFVTDDFAMIPGPRIPLLAKRFAELLHPDLKGKLEPAATSRPPSSTP
ncbi:MAG: cobalamin-binding protein [Phycisphaerae bacterium]|nr:cobalamin-binding protein [Phycisphaerae bacterium]